MSIKEREKYEKITYEDTENQATEYSTSLKVKSKEKLREVKEDLVERGWTTKKYDGEKLVIYKRSYGKWYIHLLLFVFGLMTFGLSNLFYAAISYSKPEKKIIRVSES